MPIEGDDMEEIRTRYVDYNRLTDFRTLLVFALYPNEVLGPTLIFEHRREVVSMIWKHTEYQYRVR